MQYLWERRSGASRVQDLPLSDSAPTQAISSPVRCERPAASPTSSTASSNLSPTNSTRRAPPARPSRRYQPDLYEDEVYQSAFDWDSEEDDAYDRRVAKVRLWSRMSIRRSDLFDQQAGSRPGSSESVETIRSSRVDAGRDRGYSESSPRKTHLSRMSSISSNLKRSSSSASRVRQLRSPSRTSIVGPPEAMRSPVMSMDRESPRDEKHRASFSSRMAQSEGRHRPVGNYF